MTFLYYSDIWKTLFVVITFSLFLDLHKTLIPNIYSTVQDFIYERNISKTIRSTAIRVLMIILLSMFCYGIMKFTTKQIVFGIATGSFLKVWPAFIQYKLLFPKNKISIQFSIEYYSFIVFCTLTSFITLKFLYPTIFNNEEFFVFSNDGFNILFSLIIYSFPITLDAFLSKFIKITTYKNIETFKEDIRIISGQMQVGNRIIEMYKYEIEKYSKQNDLPRNLLTAILLLEIINRGQWYNRLLEIFCCYCFPNLSIKKDISVGVSQIKISTAEKVLKKSPLRFIKRLINNTYNISVCAKYLKNLINKFEEEKVTNPYYFNIDMYEYIASQYLKGTYIPEDKNILIYSALLRNFCNNPMYNIFN